MEGVNLGERVRETEREMEMERERGNLSIAYQQLPSSQRAQIIKLIHRVLASQQTTETKWIPFH